MRVWEGQMVVFDPYSGDTHCLDRLATALISCLAERGPATTERLRTHLGDFPDLVSDLGEGDAPGSALEELEKLGLVQSVNR